MYMLIKNDFLFLNLIFILYQLFHISFYFLNIFLMLHYLMFLLDNHDIHHYQVLISIYNILYILNYMNNYNINNFLFFPLNHNYV